MTAQINLFVPAAKPNPMLAATRNEDFGRNTASSRENDSFESVMAEPAATDDETGSLDQHAGRDEANADDRSQGDQAETAENRSETSDTTQTDDADNAEKSFAEGDSTTGGAGSGVADHADTEFGEAGVREASTTTDDGEVTGKSGTGANGTENSTALPGPKETRVPAWFAATQGNGNLHAQTIRIKGVQNAAEKTSGVENATALVGSAKMAATSAATPATDDPNATIHGKAAAPGQTVEAPGLQVKAAVKQAAGIGSVSMAALANAPGQTKGVGEDPQLAVERRRDDKNATDLSPLLRHTKPATAVTPSQTPPVQAVAIQNPGMSNGIGEEGNIRWVSDAAFSSEIGAAEMPATSRLQMATLLQQPDLPRNVAVQLAAAMRQGGAERPMELVLNPAELGRVRISMKAGEGAMTVHVLAERPETLDLMRRNIEVLAQEFHDIGFGTAEFSFGQNETNGDGGSDGDSDHGDQTTRERGDIIDDRQVADLQTQLSIDPDRVDIRL